MSNPLPPFSPDALRQLAGSPLADRANVNDALLGAAERIEILLQEVNRLTNSIAWRCSSCGCAFPDNPYINDGSDAECRLCSNCADAESLCNIIDKLGQENAKMCDEGQRFTREVERLQTQLHNIALMTHPDATGGVAYEPSPEAIETIDRALAEHDREANQ